MPTATKDTATQPSEPGWVAVRMLVQVTGSRLTGTGEWQTWPPAGKAVKLRKADAEHMVAAGYAELVDKPAPRKRTAPAAGKGEWNPVTDG